MKRLRYVPTIALIIGSPPFIMWLVSEPPTIPRVYALVGMCCFSGFAAWLAVRL